LLLLFLPLPPFLTLLHIYQTLALLLVEV